MGEIRKVINGELNESIGEFNGNILGQPFLCVYGEVEPRVAKGQTLIQWPLCGKLNTYIRFVTSQELDNHMKNIGEGEISGSIVFTEEIAEHMKLDKDEVLAEAKRFIHEDYILKSMLSLLMGVDGDMINENEPMHMIKVVTTKHAVGCYGAGVLASMEILEEIRKTIGDFYIIPSSIHEVITVPKTLGHEFEGIKRMITEVNSTVVDSQEVLANALYSYDSEGLKEL